jgi:biopolymer transport protein ExbD
VTEDISEKVGRRLNAKASHDRMVECSADQKEDYDTIMGLMKKYPG